MSTLRDSFSAITAVPLRQRLAAIHQLPDMHRVWFVLMLALSIPAVLLGFQALLWVLGAVPSDYVLGAVRTAVNSVLSIGRMVLAGLGGGHDGMNAFTTLLLGNLLVAYVGTIIQMVRIHQNDKALNDEYYAEAIRNAGSITEKVVLAGLFLFALVSTAALNGQANVNAGVANQAFWVVSMVVAMGTCGGIARAVTPWSYDINQAYTYRTYIAAALPALVMGMNILNLGLFLALVTTAAMLHPLSKKVLRGSAQKLAREERTGAAQPTY